MTAFTAAYLSWDIIAVAVSATALVIMAAVGARRIGQQAPTSV